MLIALFLCFNASAQIKHYISYNTIPYTNFFNKEKDIITVTGKLIFPSFNYKFEKGKFGLELFYISTRNSYYNFSYQDIPNPDSNILDVKSFNIGFTVHYNVLDKKWIKINPNIGMINSWYNAELIHSWRILPNWYEPHLFYQKESKIGFIIGTNFNFPIYQGIYANTNLRYALFPTAEFNKQNLFWEVGIGYMFTRNKKK